MLQQLPIRSKSYREHITLLHQLYHIQEHKEYEFSFPVQPWFAEFLLGGVATGQTIRYSADLSSKLKQNPGYQKTKLSQLLHFEYMVSDGSIFLFLSSARGARGVEATRASLNLRSFTT